MVKFIRKIYDNLSDDSLLMIAFTGRTASDELMKSNSEENFNDLFKGKCFLKYKCDALDNLNQEIIYNELDVKKFLIQNPHKNIKNV